MIHIYRAEKRDAMAIQQCCDEAFEEYRSLIGKKPAPMHYNYLEQITKYDIFVASNGTEIVGFVLIKDGKENYMWLDVLAVKPKFAGMGIGRKLISYCERYILQKGKTECRLYTNVKFKRTCNIYTKLGYEIYDTRCIDGYERYYMKKDLASVKKEELDKS